jgi:hypothetical protein
MNSLLFYLHTGDAIRVLVQRAVGSSGSKEAIENDQEIAPNDLS